MPHNIASLRLAQLTPTAVTAHADAAGRLRVFRSQASRPALDHTDGSWTPSTGADLYAVLDETTADNSDYIQSATDPSSDTAIVRLQALADPALDTGFVVRLRVGKDMASGNRIDITATLQAGTTDIASATFADVAAGFTHVQFSLTPAEVQSFRAAGGFADPRLKLVATKV